MDFGELLDKSRSEIYIFATDTLRFLHVNLGARENLGYSLETLQGMTPVDIKPEFTHSDFMMLMEPLTSGKTDKLFFATVHERKDGSSYPVDVHVQREVHAGEPVYLAIILDVTERRQVEDHARELEEQLRQAQRVEAIGRLAGGVAHDFNNLLTVIVSRASMLDELGDSIVCTHAKAILDASERAAGVTKQLLALGRRQVLEPRTISLNKIVVDLRPLFGRLLREDIRLETSLAPDLDPVRADPVQIEQVLINLVSNARDAMPDGGEIVVETMNVRSSSAEQEGAHDRYACLRVSDDGGGMDEETQAHIFEPFFSTKGQGTGLGLATVHGIVMQSGGRIEVKSGDQSGTSFCVLLPVSDALPQGESQSDPSCHRVSKATILLVEDNEDVRQSAILGLESYGYRVLGAADGPAALDVSRHYVDDIDLLVSDVVMPHMNGPTLARQLRLERANLPVLFMSGYADGAVAGEEMVERGEAFLQKPFTPRSLQQKVEAILRNEPEGH